MRTIRISKSVAVAFVLLAIGCVLCAAPLQKAVSDRARQAIVQAFVSCGVECEAGPADYDILADALTVDEWSLAYPDDVIESVHIGPTTFKGFNRFAMLAGMLGFSSPSKSVTVDHVEATLLRALGKDGGIVISARSADASDISIPLDLPSRRDVPPASATTASEWLRRTLTTYGPILGRLVLDDVTFGKEQAALLADAVILEYRAGTDFSVVATLANVRIPADDGLDLGIPGILGCNDLRADLSVRATVPGTSLRPILLAASVDAPAIGVLSLDAGVFAGPSTLADVVSSPLDNILLDRAALSLTDRGLGARVAGICKSVLGLNPDVFVPQLRSVAWELLPDRSRTKGTRAMLDSLARFIERPGTITLSVTPPEPNPLSTAFRSWHEIVTATVVPGPKALSELTDRAVHRPRCATPDGCAP